MENWLLTKFVMFFFKCVKDAFLETELVIKKAIERTAGELHLNLWWKNLNLCGSFTPLFFLFLSFWFSCESNVQPHQWVCIICSSLVVWSSFIYSVNNENIQSYRVIMERLTSSARLMIVSDLDHTMVKALTFPSPFLLINE